MRFAFYLALVVATFVASSMGSTSAEDTAATNDAAHTELSDSDSKVRNLRGRPSDEEMTGGATIAASAVYLNSRPSGHGGSEYSTHMRKKGKAGVALLFLLGLGLLTGGAVATVAYMNKHLPSV
ncbi:hypothetical protein PR003_g25227 [Phytophthora rubi]|uniref:RxLR effector protein n=1 Tax=Phytophthora rubi TaxID=129364 RepID=A0A6A4CFV2_9STRA|nr:hypothetical protein PR002_g24326 [Phytophthora rubi]KAE8981476.1 hypothetical protein PR001_g23991 [Phytophthora rubi]KAE9290674.1 hypothetical protein PR003_g25227 [Phytophthora rubi]